MSGISVLLKSYWLMLFIFIYVIILFLSIISDAIYYSLSNMILLILGVVAIFVATSLEKLKIILFLGKNKNTLLKAQVLLLFFASIIIYLCLYNLNLLKSLSRWD